jgi:hypothetical protein
VIDSWQKRYLIAISLLLIGGAIGVVVEHDYLFARYMVAYTQTEHLISCLRPSGLSD